MTARSLRPLPRKSPTTTAYGFVPVAVSTCGEKDTVAACAARTTASGSIAAISRTRTACTAPRRTLATGTRYKAHLPDKASDARRRSVKRARAPSAKEHVDEQGARGQERTAEQQMGGGGQRRAWRDRNARAGGVREGQGDADRVLDGSAGQGQAGGPGAVGQ